MKVLSVVGRLGNDPELKFSNGGSAILNASVACDYQRKSRDGEYERHTQWIRVIVFGKRAESLAKVLTKGMRVAASGDFQLNEFTGRDGDKRTSVEVIANDIEPLFDKKQDGGERQERREPASSGGGFGGGFEGAGSTDDDIPFGPLRGEI
jgi:single-strand DNA-binding protein